MIVVGDAGPVDIASTRSPTAIGFHLPLTLDAERAVGQCIEPSDQNLAAARLALTIGALFQTSESSLDLSKFFGLKFGQLRGHFFAGGVEGGIGRIPTLRRFPSRKIGQFNTQT